MGPSPPSLGLVTQANSTQELLATSSSSSTFPSTTSSSAAHSFCAIYKSTLFIRIPLPTSLIYNTMILRLDTIWADCLLASTYQASRIQKGCIIRA
jgi:hypothetical protein